MWVEDLGAFVRVMLVVIERLHLKLAFENP